MADGDCDVVVIGAGPAGSAAATLLARRGLRVAVLERERFPREHVGESLLPASLPILEELGVLDQVRAEGFVKKWGATMVWGREPEPWSWYFRETNLSYPHAFQVWRPRFDQILAEGAQRSGAELRFGCAAREVVFQEGVAVAVDYTERGGGGRIRARMVIDASGQSSLLARRLRLRRFDPFFRNLAVYGYFRGADRLPEPDQGNIFIESYERGWLWLIPLHTGLCSVGAVVDRDRARLELRQRGGDRFLRDQLARAPHTRRLVGGASLEGGPRAIRDWSYRSARVVGPGWVLAGDAACFVDPLFSSGVHLALSSAVLAAAYAATVLREPQLHEPAAAAYARLYGAQYEHFHELARLFYAANRTVESYFWAARRLLPGGEDYAPREAFVRAVAGQPPQGYERATLSHGELDPRFARRMRSVERERAERRARFERTRQGGTVPGLVPRLAKGMRLARRALLEDGAFRLGPAIVDRRGREIPVSAPVAALVALVDGATSLADMVGRMTPDPRDRARVLEVLGHALELLYVDGVIAELKGLER